MTKNAIYFLRIMVLAGLLSCTATTTEQPLVSTTVSGNPTEAEAVSDTLPTTQKKDVAIYTAAIRDYLEAIHQKDKTRFETLYISYRCNGVQDDSITLDLPGNIDGVEVVARSTSQAEVTRDEYTETSPFINLIAWVDEGRAEFIFVTFFPEFSHQYDVYINYVLNPLTQTYECEKVTIEVLVTARNGKPDHFEVYEGGNYVGDKPVE